MTTPGKPAKASASQEAAARRGPAGPGRFMGGQGAEKSMDFKGSGKRLLSLMRPQRKLLAGVLALGTLSIGCAVTGPKILGNATDLIVAGVMGKQFPHAATKAQAVEQARQAGGSKLADLVSATDFTPGQGMDFDAIGTVLLWVLAIYVASAVFGIIQGRLATTAIQRTVYRLRQDVESKIARLPLSYFDKQPRGEVLSRVTNDIDNIGQSMQQTMGQVVNSCSLSSACWP
ncbi:hypothetical protein GCM10025734_31290 [Kitasatospora paranensis]